MEEDLRPPATPHPAAWAATLALPVSLCLAVIAMGLLTVSARRPEPEARVQWVPAFSATPSRTAPSRAGPPRLFLFEPDSAHGLVRLLDAAWSAPGTEDAVPNLAPVRLPTDMDELATGAKKRAFFRSLLPHVLASNRLIRADRARLRGVQERLRGGAEPDRDERALLADLAERYRVDLGGQDPMSLAPSELVTLLLERVDVVPPSLALAQAAIESAWGSSRFARLGNSLFGQWVFSPDKGIAPLKRPEAANYSVARFADLAQAVEAYVRNLNTFWAYEDFRALRRGMRENGGVLDPQELARGLLLYSERREEYVDEVRRVIRSNRLGRFDGRRLRPVSEDVWAAVLGDELGGPSLRGVQLPD